MTHAASIAIDLTEFRRSWRIVIVALLGLAVSANVAMLYAFGALVIPLQNAFGWSRGELQSAIGFLFAGAVVSAQILGIVNERFGMRRVTAVSLVALALTFAAMTLMGRWIGWLYLLFAIAPIAGMGALNSTWTQLIALWYERNRGLALALMLSGSGLSGALMPSAVTWAVGRWGWQAPFLLMAALPLAVLPLVLAWMKEPRESVRKATAVQPPPTSDADSGMSFSQGLRSGRFWLLNLALGLAVAGMITMVTNTVPLLRDKGLPAVQASQVFGSFGIALILGRITVGYLVDRLWAPGVAAVAMSMPAVGCLLLLTTGADHVGLLALGTLLVGIGAGAEFDIAAFLMARYFGMRHYGRLFGVHIGVTTTVSATTPWLFGQLYAATGSYGAMLTICGVGFLTGALLLLSLGRYPNFSRAPMVPVLSH